MATPRSMIIEHMRFLFGYNGDFVSGEAAAMLAADADAIQQQADRIAALETENSRLRTSIECALLIGVRGTLPISESPAPPPEFAVGAAPQDELVWQASSDDVRIDTPTQEAPDEPAAW